MEEISAILQQALSGSEITPDQAVSLLSYQEPTAIAAIKTTADQLRQQQVGDIVTYVVNRNLNFTNICEQHCGFCAFRRDAGSDGAFWLNSEQILEKTADAVSRGATEICMQGGLNPHAKINGGSLAYYLQLVETIKRAFPAVHLHAFSPQEIEFIAREDHLSYEYVLISLRDEGVNSLPGTAAEILDDQVRKIICPEKINSQTWLEIISTAHRLGIPTTSTMLSGHIETPIQQIQHLEKLKRLQQVAQEKDYPASITEFIILPFVGEQAPKALRHRVGRIQPDLKETLRLTAVARIFLGKWIPNHQPSWVKLGLNGATEALQWGCNDLGGTLMEEHITSMAGATGGTCMEIETLQKAIAGIGRAYRQRSTLYEYLEHNWPIYAVHG
ncbi:7,8-didemethyl-8-hydroxy-5-deazariboflavin synthase subunit CofH [Gloeocapsa sp. PCC 73106]|uniref:7,8-didemethyl-8-hydroxy-5-deazariboflavin synthase subunit CofH n=1 Tax=Gloeocapsa sp. PCC 73106 TaxID=102232 RepID=UPI0002ABC94A|nr:7,8-didemethyl-8-hydroxy-5-deazariboflavin synthase subunit CofH [Gloeocapsa sp. PCC 73106]ELR99384.1 FO synthase subunit 2 [Gloeocapsa sp. PCC 73106]